MYRYRCHKEVRAGKIREMRPPQEPRYNKPVCKGCAALNSNCGTCERCVYNRDPESQRSLLDIGDSIPANMSREWMNKHKPVVGGYLVLYDDGYCSFSPAEAFESGYTRIS